MSVDGMTWEDGDLSYQFWSAQEEALGATQSGDYDLVAFTGGNRSGKTLSGARWLISNAYAIAGTHWLAMGISFRSSQGSTYDTLFEQLPPHDTDTTEAGRGPESSPIVRDWNGQKKRLTLTNGSVIWLASATGGASSYEGYELSGAWLDEFARYPDGEHYELLDTILTRFSSGVGPRAILVTTTGDGYNEAYDIIERRVDREGEDLGMSVEWVQANTLDNPFIDDEFKEQLRRRYEGTREWEQRVRGGFVASEGRVYSQFSRNTHVVGDDVLEQLDGNWRMYGYDAGWGDPRVVIEVGKTHSGQFVVLDEFYESQSHVRDAVEWLRDKPRGTIYSEHEPADIDRFKSELGWQVEKADKSIDAGISEVRRRLQGEDGDVGLVVHEDCENTIQEFLSYKEEQVGTSSAQDHSMDSLRYAVFTEQSSSGGFQIDMHQR